MDRWRHAPLYQRPGQHQGTVIFRHVPILQFHLQQPCRALLTCYILAIIFNTDLRNVIGASYRKLNVPIPERN